VARRLTIVTSDAILTRGLRGRTWLVGAFLGLIAGAGMYVATPPAFTATAVVELAEASPVIDLSPLAARPRLVSVDTDAQIVVSDEVLSAVADATNQPTTVVRRSLVVTARPLTRVIQISYRTASAATARAGAQRAAEAFLGERERLFVDPVQAYLTEVDARSQSPDQPAATTPADLSSRAQSRVESWRQRAMAARLEITGAGAVLESARVKAGGSRGNPEVPVVTGACLGALLGVGVALARGRLTQGRLTGDWSPTRRTPEVVA
jgi:hypothetical protein